MAEYSRFFGGPEWAIPEYTQPQFAEVLKKIFSNGVFSGILNELQVVECDPIALAIRVKSGEGWIEGFWYQNTAYLTKSLAAADPTNPRIDRIILRLNTVTNFKISIEVLTGTPAAEPTAPTLTQTASTYEISLVQVLVEATVTSVNNSKITDERTYAAISGLEVTLTNAVTLTNKRITKRVVSITTSSTPTPNGDITDIYTVTALAEPATLGAPSGTPTPGQVLVVRIKDNGTARALGYNVIYRAIGQALPTTTKIGKTLYLGFIYNSVDSKWDCPNAIAEEA